MATTSGDDLARERLGLLERLDRLLDRPLTVLSAVWLVLLVVELSTGSLPPLLDVAVYAIWAVFILDFVVGIVIAPDRAAYLRRNWLSAIALVLPALRLLRVFAVLRFLRAGRVLRSTALLRVVTGANRGLDTTARVLGRRGVGYLVAATLLVLVVGAAGMAAFESPASLREAGSPIAGEPGAGIDGYGEAVWWTAMTLTTIGTEDSPQTAEGRVLGFLVSLWGLGVFGYLTAVLASHFVGRDRLDAGGVVRGQEVAPVVTTGATSGDALTGQSAGVSQTG